MHGDLEGRVDGLLRPVGDVLEGMFAGDVMEIGKFLAWFRAATIDDSSAFLKDFAQRFEAPDRSFAVCEPYDLRLRFMKMVYEKGDRPRDFLWNLLEVAQRAIAKRRVVPEGF